MKLPATLYHSTEFVNSDDLLPTSEFCPFCASLGARREVHRLQRSPDVNLLECAKCYAISADRVPKGARLAAYYAGYYDDEPSSKVTVGLPLAAVRHIRKILHNDWGRYVRILDFGGGDGELSWLLAGELVRNYAVDTVDIFVVDFSAPTEPRAEGGVRLVGVQSLDKVMGDDAFDLVIASAIIEHLPDPMAELRILLGMLSDRGQMYLRTPWMVPLMRASAKIGISLDFTFPGHLHDLGGRFWKGFVELPSRDGMGLSLLKSRPSFVETSFRRNPSRTTLAYLLKLPASLVGARWPYVGGWEVVLGRNF